MSGFENYESQLGELDHEISKYAMLCRVNLKNRYEIDACLNQHHDSWAEDKSRETLKGLLILRIKVETEMIENGQTPPSFLFSPSTE